MLVNVHRSDTQNVGDLMSSPVHYFPEFSDTPIIDLMGWQSDSEEVRNKWNNVYSKCDTVIVGGGGLLEMPKFESSILKILEEKTRVILWGCGHNSAKLESWAAFRRTYSLDMSRFMMCGTRDFGVSDRWVPCVTTMSGLFDLKYEVKNEFAFFANKGMKNNSIFIPKDFPKEMVMGNMRHSMEHILKFLGSAEIIITSSFHGAYWATLLGKKVVAVPTSSKFYGLRHPVPLCHASDWKRYTQLARAYPEALEECRDANVKFKDDVLNKINY